ncbi:MAG: hypothetical protein ACYC5Q_00025 [Thermoleophilia bacterium]
MTGSEGRVDSESGDGSVVADYRVSASALEAIVRWSLVGDETLRAAGGGALGGRHPIGVSVSGVSAVVTVNLRARLGEDLLALGARVKRTVAWRLGAMTGLVIARVDVHVVGVFPPGDVEA